MIRNTTDVSIRCMSDECLMPSVGINLLRSKCKDLLASTDAFIGRLREQEMKAGGK